MSVIDEVVNNLDIVDYISRYTRLKKSGTRIVVYVHCIMAITVIH